jgi:hypothetical protein
MQKYSKVIGVARIIGFQVVDESSVYTTHATVEWEGNISTYLVLIDSVKLTLEDC